MKQRRKLVLTMALVAVSAITAGCFRDRRIDLRGEGFQPDMTLDQKYRGADGSSDQQGFSNKARSIESNLGVR